jgi:hypothetical protein
MIKMNQLMWDNQFGTDYMECNLNAELNGLTSEGFTKEKDCFFLSVLYKKNINASLENFPDRTGFECFVNSIHIDDYVNENYFKTSLSFIKSIIKNCSSSFIGEQMRFIIVNNEFGCVVKFHIVRNGESWLSDSLDGYADEVMVFDL